MLGLACPGGVLSIHAPREGCDNDMAAGEGDFVLSIHAPREGCDWSTSYDTGDIDPLSIHTPREGCDLVPGEG